MNENTSVTEGITILILLTLICAMICGTILARDYLKRDLTLRSVTTTTNTEEAHEGIWTFPAKSSVTTVEYK